MKGFAVSATVFACVLLFGSVGHADDKKAKGDVEVFNLLIVTPNELAGDFEKNPEAAKKKYSSAPSPAGTPDVDIRSDGALNLNTSGTYIKIEGAVEVLGDKVYLKNVTKLKILLNPKKLPEKDGRWTASLFPATFKEFKDNTIVLEGGVSYERISGDK